MANSPALGLVWWAVLLTANCSRCLALDPTRLISQYHKQSWQVEDGLPNNQVTGIGQLPDGYMLVGTPEGLAKFDGKRFLPFDTDPPRGLAHHGSLIQTSHDGTIWISNSAELLRWQNGKPISRFPGRATAELVEGPSGALWINSYDRIWRFEQGKYERVEGLGPVVKWSVLTGDSKGGVWVVTVDGLFRVRGRSISRVLPKHSAYGDPRSIAADRTGSLWLGTSKGLFEVLESGQGFQFHRRSAISAPMMCVLKDRNNVLWVGTWGKGLYRVTTRGVESWTTREGLSDDFIQTLFEDREGSLWIGTSGGLSRWNDVMIVPFGVPEGLMGNFASAIYESRKGDLWLGTWRSGLYRLQSGALVRQPSPSSALNFAVRALAGDARGNIWIGHWGGLYRFDGFRYRSFASGADSPYYRVSALLVDRRGALWIGTPDKGLFRCAGGEPARTGDEQLLRDANITALLEDSQGTVWVGSSRGLGRFQNGEVGAYRETAGVPVDSVTSVSEDSRRRVWACSRTGALFLVSSPRTVTFNTEQGLPGRALYRILDDGSGGLWLSSLSGILRLATVQIDEVLAGRRQRLDVTVYGQESGMRTVECHGLSQPAGCRQRDGTLWFPTAKGFVRIRPGERLALSPPKVVIEGVTDGTKLLQASPGVLLEPGVRALQLQFTALRSPSPEQVRFRYRMEGLDPEWIETSERTVRFSRIPPGQYRFLVSAQDPGGLWSEPPAFLEIRQLPRLHENAGFRVALALFAVVLLATVYRWRVYVLRGSYAAVAAERNRIAREWHDVLLAGFSAISLQVGMAISRLKEQPEQAAKILAITVEMVQHYRTEARRVIWDLRDNNAEPLCLIDRISGAMEHLADTCGVTVDVAAAGHATRLSREIEHNVLRICQEAAANAVTHGKPRHVEVRIEYLPGTLRAIVRDDGAGFDAGAVMGSARGHFGLTIMQERAGRFGGQVRVESEPGHGTTVEAIIPLESIEEE